MRSVVFIFFLLITFQLIGEKFNGQSLHSISLPGSHILKKGEGLKEIYAIGDEPIIKTDDSVEETSLVSLEDDDEDFITRKLTLLTRYFIAFSPLFLFLFYSGESFLKKLQDYSFSSSLGSRKYILLRVLRI
jgi:hypothetical protein